MGTHTHAHAQNSSPGEQNGLFRNLSHLLDAEIDERTEDPSLRPGAAATDEAHDDTRESRRDSNLHGDPECVPQDLGAASVAP